MLRQRRNSRKRQTEHQCGMNSQNHRLRTEHSRKNLFWKPKRGTRIPTKNVCFSPAQQASCASLSGRSVAWLARVFRVHEVVSSNLTAPTIILKGISLCSCFPNRILTVSAHAKEKG